ncbi:MAG TPA: hypothetical protein VJ775_02475 [Sphingomicrobium sp.]|nr:hypothetical protein [Sphingomicrobium sp.]
MAVEGSATTVAFEAFEPRIVIPADALAGMTGTLAISVLQVGDYAESRPASTSIAI